jgi:transcriptional regulator with XRE-family HTH domain
VTNEFGSMLRGLRQRTGLTQEALAERAQVGLHNLRGLESGQLVDPSVSMVRLLADALGLAPEDHEELVAAASAHYAEPVAGQSGSVLDETLIDVAEQLAQAVAARWRREEEQRQVHGPHLLPVCWRPVAELTDFWGEARRLPAGVAHGPLDLSGQLDEIVDVYRRLPTGRLVVVGRPGSGKTFLAVEFVLRHLRSRARTEPVPVIFRIGSWDPTVMTFRGWLITQLIHDHPALAARRASGSSLAAALVEAGWVLPVLDGFDEIDDGLRSSVVKALNATIPPLLLMSRSAEYATVVRESYPLASAATVELTDLTLSDLADYLPRTTRGACGGNLAARSWDRVFTELRERPGSRAAANLTAVLTTPLMVMLARTIYSDTADKDPTALLDTERFSSPKALEQHLLGSFTAAVYRPLPERRPGDAPRRGYDPERAQCWLGYLADHLTLCGPKWWNLGYGLRDATRTLVTALVICLVIGFVDGVVGVLLAPAGFKFVDGLVAGLLAGLIFGTVYWFRVAKGAPVAPAWLVGEAAEARRQRTLRRRRLAMGPLCGLGFGFGFGFVTPALPGGLWRIGLPAGVRLDLAYGVIYGLAFALGAGVTFGLLPDFKTPIYIRSAVSPVGLLRSNRRMVAAQLLVWAPTFGLLVGLGAELVVWPLSGVLGPLLWTPMAALQLGVISGLGAALGYALSLTVWGQWVVFARIWLPLTGRLPWSLVTFLEDAQQRGVLRKNGAFYEFRYAELQNHLAQAFSQKRHGRLRGALTGQRQTYRDGENRMAAPKRISPWVIFSIAVALLLLLSWVSVRDILENLQIHGSLGPSDAPAVVTAVVSIATAVGALIGGTLTGLSKYVQARGQAYAEKTRADADMLRARADVHRAEAGLPSLGSPPAGGTPSPQPDPSE